MKQLSLQRHVRLLHRNPAPFQSEEHEDDEEFVREMVQQAKLPPLGRVLSVLLAAKPQDLHTSTSSTQPARHKGSIVQALVSLQQHALFEMKRGYDLTNLLLPLLEHVVKSRERSNRKQVVNIMTWLFRDADTGMYVAGKFIGILQSGHVDTRIMLGWCVVVRDMLQQRVQANDFSNGFGDTILVPLGRCIPKLFDLMSGSKDSPTRLMVMAADCIILISKCIADDCDMQNEMKGNEVDDDAEHISSAVVDPSRVRGVLDPSGSSCTDTSTSGRTKEVGKVELLWEQLDTLLDVVFRLRKWNEKSWPLYSIGLLHVAKCLENLAYFRDALKPQDKGDEDLGVLMTVLSSYWNRYSVLMLVDSSILHMDKNVMLQQWIEGLQHTLHVEEPDEDSASSTRKAEEMQVFLLTCLALLLGRLTTLEVEGVVQEFGPILLQALFGQLHSKHANVVDLAIAVLRALLFQTELVNSGTLKIETVAPLLMDLLDERDAVSKAVGVLVAEYFAINPCAPEMERLFKILSSGDSAQRQNALGVLSELLEILASSEHDMANPVRQSIASHLLKRLGDSELVNRIEVSQLFSKLDPEFVLPALAQQVYSRDEKVRSAASASIVALLKGHRDPCATLCVLLDCTRNITQKAYLPMHPGDIRISSKEASPPDTDRIMRLIPSWACEVQGWQNIIDVILNKMFSEPSNPVIPRFLSQISNQLLDNIDAVLQRVFMFMVGQTRLSEECVQMLNKGDGQFQERLNSLIFERLSPLLVLKVLPLAAFDGSCVELYGGHSGSEGSSICEESCIMQLLMDRACGAYEAHEVRKLAAELVGRCNPNIILPLLKESLQHAVDHQATMELKSYLFSLCTVVLLRGKAALDNPCMPCIQRSLMQILLWPCSSTDTDTYNVQHGAIDCLSLMIVSELEYSATIIASIGQPYISTQRISAPRIIEEIEVDTDECRSPNSQAHEAVFTWVIASLIGQRYAGSSFGPAQESSKMMLNTSEVVLDDFSDNTSFRICMANILIRATQRIALEGRRLFLSQVLPPVTEFIQAGENSHITVACLQLLFSVVHNFKEQIMSHAVDLFNLSLGLMRSKASSEERLAATRLLASLLTSPEVVMTEVAPYLSEAVITLDSIARMDSSRELRELCEKLVECMRP